MKSLQVLICQKWNMILFKTSDILACAMKYVERSVVQRWDVCLIPLCPRTKPKAGIYPAFLRNFSSLAKAWKTLTQAASTLGLIHTGRHAHAHAQRKQMGPVDVNGSNIKGFGIEFGRARPVWIRPQQHATRGVNKQEPGPILLLVASLRCLVCALWTLPLHLMFFLSYPGLLRLSRRVPVWMAPKNYKLTLNEYSEYSDAILSNVCLERRPGYLHNAWN